MDGTGTNWWMDARKSWHRGRPPAGSWQAENGRWLPPGEHEPSAEVEDRSPAGPAHIVRGPRELGADETLTPAPITQLCS
jgi:hypothetical protein